MLIASEATHAQAHIRRGSVDDPGALAVGGGRNDLVGFTRTGVAGRFVLGQSDGFFIRPEVRFNDFDFDDLVTTDAVTGDPYDVPISTGPKRYSL